MLNLSRAELEDIWNNKPYGYFTNLRKNSKNLKRFEVHAQPYKRLDVEVFKTTVYAVSASSTQIEDAKKDLRKQILEKNPNDTKIRIEFIVTPYK